MLAVKSYSTTEATLLSFQAGALIRLVNEGAEGKRQEGKVVDSHNIYRTSVIVSKYIAASKT